MINSSHYNFMQISLCHCKEINKKIRFTVNFLIVSLIAGSFSLIFH